NADDLRRLGDLLTGNLYRLRDLPPGTTEVTLDSFEPSDGPVTIQLDPGLSPAGNAKRYYARYQKAKNTLQKAAEQVESSLAEARYLESVETSLELAQTQDDLDEIYDELSRQGYVGDKEAKSGKRPR